MSGTREAAYEHQIVLFAAVSYAPEWTRTTTPFTRDKALNLIHRRHIRTPASRSSVLLGFTDASDTSDDLSVAAMLPRPVEPGLMNRRPIPLSPPGGSQSSEPSTDRSTPPCSRSAKYWALQLPGHQRRDDGADARRRGSGSRRASCASARYLGATGRYEDPQHPQDLSLVERRRADLAPKAASRCGRPLAAR
jgi:hypothetical protein